MLLPIALSSFGLESPTANRSLQALNWTLLSTATQQILRSTMQMDRLVTHFNKLSAMYAFDLSDKGNNLSIHRNEAHTPIILHGALKRCYVYTLMWDAVLFCAVETDYIHSWKDGTYFDL